MGHAGGLLKKIKSDNLFLIAKSNIYDGQYAVWLHQFAVKNTALSAFTFEQVFIDQSTIHVLLGHFHQEQCAMESAADVMLGFHVC